MLNIRKHMAPPESHSEITASKILTRISSRKGFNVADYFKPQALIRSKTQKLFIPPLKTEKKIHYTQWELKNSMKSSKGFRSRRREVLEKLKLKSVDSLNFDFEISPLLKEKFENTSNVKTSHKRSTKFK